MGSPGKSKAVRGCLWSKTLVAQCEIGDRVADELLVHVLFDVVGDNGLNGGSGTGGKMPLSDSSDHTGDIAGGYDGYDGILPPGN